jgi:hypothetical protein
VDGSLKIEGFAFPSKTLFELIAIFRPSPLPTIRKQKVKYHKLSVHGYRLLSEDKVPSLPSLQIPKDYEPSSAIDTCGMLRDQNSDIKYTSLSKMAKGSFTFLIGLPRQKCSCFLCFSNTSNTQVQSRLFTKCYSLRHLLHV